jgi:hypothetical protein
MHLRLTKSQILTVHRQFQLSCFRDRRFAFSQVGYLDATYFRID